ncbi:unnamed protein product [Symbiodinium microadriaticum]|nr:unnamed protein product [Symbiodinium microadriaticum]CAE7687431.1 unnamed protein product [Symbiodinium sp. KB8]
MSSYLELFAALQRQASDTTVLNVDAVEAGLLNLHEVAVASDEDDRRLGPPSCETRIVGDPEIVDQYDNYFHYLGPALVLCLDHRGVVRTLEFVGVQGGKKDSNYIRDVWQYSIKTQKWKYRDLRQMQGTPAHRITCRDARYYGRDWTSQGDEEFHPGNEDWDSEKAADDRPPRQFLAKFKNWSETFFINLRSGTFARGPTYGLLKKVIEDPKPFLQPLLSVCRSPGEWMERAAGATRVIPPSGQVERKWKPQKPSDAEHAVQVAQLVLGLTAARSVSASRL